MTKQNQPQQTGVPRRIPLSKFNQYHPWPSVPSMRNRACQAKKGIDPEFGECIEHCGHRVLVNEQKFVEWLERRIRRHKRTDSAAA